MNELALKNSAQGEKFKEFLNIFQKRLYMLKYEVWKHGYGPLFVSSYKTPYAKILRSISGNKLSSSNLSQPYSVAGLMGKKSCSTLSLVNILQVLTGFSVKIKENIEQWISYKRKISENLLGENIILGKRYLDNRKLFFIKINCMTIKNIKKIYENKVLFKEMQSIIQLCLDPSISYELFLEATDGFFPISLGSTKFPLGLGGMLGCSSAQKHCSIKFIYNREFRNPSYLF
jgi:predicted component of type VI protein secretion system